MRCVSDRRNCAASRASACCSGRCNKNINRHTDTELRCRSNNNGCACGSSAADGQRTRAVTERLTVHGGLHIPFKTAHFGIDRTKERAIVRSCRLDGGAGDLNATVLIFHRNDTFLVGLTASIRKRAALSSRAHALVAAVVQGDGEVFTDNGVLVLFQSGIQNGRTVELFADGAEILCFENCVKCRKCRTCHYISLLIVLAESGGLLLNPLALLPMS